jgi:integrase
VARPKNTVPSYKLHKPSGQARVRIDGRDVYLGRYNSSESRQEYARVVAELNGSPAAPHTPQVAARSPSLNEVLVAFLRHAEQHYRRPDGTTTNELKEYRLAMRPLRRLYGHTAAAGFGPIALQAVRAEMVRAGWCRTRVNKQVGRLKRVFKWAAAQEVVPVSVVQALACVGGLQRGRTDARETEPVGPVDDDVVNATLPHLWPTVRAMVRLQQHTGMRPGEVRALRVGDVDRTGATARTASGVGDRSPVIPATAELSSLGDPSRAKAARGESRRTALLLLSLAPGDVRRLS